MMLSEADARQLFAGDRANALVASIRAGFDRFTTEGYLRPPTTQAQIINDRMVEEADSRFAVLSGVTRIEAYNKPIYLVDDIVGVRLKLHVRGTFKTSNIRTARQDALARQLPLDGFPDNAEYVSAGYVLDASGAIIEQVVMTRRNGDQLDWIIDLDDLAAGNLAPSKPTLPLPVTPRAVSGVAQLKARHDNAEQHSNE